MYPKFPTMPELMVTSAHPNPPGKDKPPEGPIPNDKLNEEWIEFQNTTSADVDLEGVSLSDCTFGQKCTEPKRRKLHSFEGKLGGNGIVRVHSGKGDNKLLGDTRHEYLDRGNYVWNNECGDWVILERGNQDIDAARYLPDPLEGVVLKRKPGTNQLLPPE
jgi:hypothetical protein